jgi:hypothetical protein
VECKKVRGQQGDHPLDGHKTPLKIVNGFDEDVLLRLWGMEIAKDLRFFLYIREISALYQPAVAGPSTLWRIGLDAGAVQNFLDQRVVFKPSDRG